MKKVTIIQRILYQYRVDFYRKLKEALLKEGIALQLIIEENKSQDKLDFLDHFHIKKSLHLRFFGYELIFQPYLGYIEDSDLLLLELNNKLLLNYLLIFKRFFSRRKKIVFWGHTLNKQADAESFGNIFKRLYYKNVDFWFPYTESMAKLLKDAGFNSEKIAVIYNTIDILKIQEFKNSIPEEEIKSRRLELGIGGFPIGIFCGRMYKEKRIDFLIEACIKIKERQPDFYMIFIGDGEDSYKIEEAAKKYAWIKYVGPTFDRGKALYFKMADVFLSPGLVGLSIIESFALEVPMVTTDYPYHSAEIEYLRNQENGVMTQNNLQDYVRVASEIFRNGNRLEALKAGCRKAAQIYTMENMVARLTKGIKDCLNG